MTAQEKNQETSSRAGVLGEFGQAFDLPKNLVTRGVNEALVASRIETNLRDSISFRAPGDGLDYSQLSLGQNGAIAMGLNPGDAPGSSTINAPVISQIAQIAKYAINTVPLVATWSLTRAQTFDSGKLQSGIDTLGRQIETEADLAVKQKLVAERDRLQSDLDEGVKGVIVETPFVSNIVRAFEGSTTYEYVSGGIDFSSWFVLDPLNYAAAAGMGWKAAKTLPRMNNLSKGRAVMQAMKPFWLGRTGGVRGNMTTRVSAAFFAKTVDEGIDLMRKSVDGRKIFRVFEGAENVEEVVRKVNGLNPELAKFLIKSAKTGKGEDFFWESYRTVLHGWNDAGDTGSFLRLNGILRSMEQDLSASARARLAAGEIGIRQVARGVFGSKTDDVYHAVGLAGNEHVVESLERAANHPNVQGAQVLETVTLKNGSEMEIRTIGDGTVFGYVDDEFVGGIRGAKPGLPDARVPVDPEIGTAIDWRRQGVYSALESHISPEGRKVIAESATITDQAKAALGQPVEGALHKVSTEAGDGVNKTVISDKMGWKEFDAGNSEQLDQLVAYLVENGQADLAAKLQNLSIGGLFEPGLESLGPQELTILRNWLDNTAQYDALRFDDEILFARRSEPKLFRGQDIDEIRPLEEVMEQELYDEARAFATRKQLTTRTHELLVTHSMPRYATGRIARSKVAKWVGLDSNTQVARVFTKIRAGLAGPVPQKVLFSKPIEGGADMEQFLKLLGASTDELETMMGRWWAADTTEGRRAAFHQNVEELGEILDDPHMVYGLTEFYKRHGEQMYLETLDGREIFAGADEFGNRGVHPAIKALMTDEVVLPNAHAMQQQLRRFKFGSKHPRLTRGFGGTKQRREELVDAIKAHIGRTKGKKVLEGILPDDLLAIAYSDVLGFAGRENGLGLTNRIFRGAAKGYNMFHTTFVVAQLALRPFAWATRVNLEEHARGWFMGLPTLLREPTLYAASMFDSLFIARRPKAYARQAVALNNSVNNLFTDGVDVGLRLADEMMPGFSARVAERGITSDDAVRSFWAAELGRALFGDSKGHTLGARGNLSRRTIFRANRLKVNNPRMMELYGIDKGFDIIDDIPEMNNKFNVLFFSDELASSVQRLDFVPNLRPRDIPAYGSGWLKKTQQLVNDQGVMFGLQRMQAGMVGDVQTYTGARFARTAYWQDVRENVVKIARARQLTFGSEDEMAEWYLDVMIRDEIIDSHFGGLWGLNQQERTRIIGQLVDDTQLTIVLGDNTHNIPLRADQYANGTASAGAMFDNLAEQGNFNFPSIGGFFNPQYANRTGKNPFRKAADWALQTFGEDVSQVLHRRPSYIAERRRWKSALEGLGWSAEDAASYGHQQAYTMVNWTFFNNQHVGSTARRMNRVVPFFSAWAEVIGTWGYKIPSVNFLPLGYVNMIHKVDRMMQGLVDIGIVEISETGQWALNLDDDPRGTTPLGQGISSAGYAMMQAPLTVVETAVNLGRWAIGEATGDEDFGKPADFSNWKADSYSLAIGSPVRLNSHGVMGVNQFQFGFTPILNYAASNAMRFAPYAGDTKLVEGSTLTEMFDNLPSDIGTAEFLETNEAKLIDLMGPDEYNLLFQSGGFTLDTDEIDVSGLQLQIPRSSWIDGIIDDTFFPFGRVDTSAGVLRELVPGSISFILRGTLGLYADESAMAEGILTVVTGTAEQYQIDAEINRQALLLEVDEGLITQATGLSEQLIAIVQKAGFDSIQEYVASAAPGSPESIRFTRVREALDKMNDQIMKRATDRAYMSLFARGIMGFMGPASPRMMKDEQEVTAQWYAAREMAEAGQIRGSLDWATALNETNISSAEDLERFSGLIAKWYEDPNGNATKAWFMDHYPSLMAFVQPITFYGPAKAPPAVRDLDNFFEDLEEGRRETYPQDVLFQRVARTAVQASRDSDFIHTIGSNDPYEQAKWFLNNPTEGAELREKYRMKMKALDMWDDELNESSYLKWRERNENDHPTRFEALEEDFYILQDIMDEIIGLAQLVDLHPEDEEQLRISLGILTREYGSAFFNLKETLTQESDYLVPREAIIGQYYEDIATPYYEERQKFFDRLENLDTRESKSTVWEMIRELENEHYLDDQEVTWDGKTIDVPSVLERTWGLRSPEEQQDQVLEWVARKPEWLSLFAIEKMIESNPAVSDYLPTTIEDTEIYTEATALKNEAIKEARENPEDITRYERDQFISAIDEWLIFQLDGELNRQEEALWIESWPIERLVLSGQLPESLVEIASWYKFIHEDLQGREKPVGPGTEAGRKQFLGLALYLDAVYFPENPQAEEDFDELGRVMFGEESRAEVYKRFYGQFQGELD